MLILLFMFNACNVFITFSFVIKSTSYNTMLKDNVDYEVDLLINDDDYEMIDKNEIKEFGVEKKLFGKFDDIARAEYNKRLITMNINDGEEMSTLPVIIEKHINKRLRPLQTTTNRNTNNNILKSTYKEQFSTHAIKSQAKSNDKGLEYNYNDLLIEYYEQADNDVGASSETPQYGLLNNFKRIFLTQYDNNNYNKSIGFKAFKSLMNDYKNQRRTKIDIMCRLWKIFQIWFLVYLIFAVPLWCTRGWCCCCLFCNFFKPHQTIEEAKKYLITNPPGVFKTKNGEVHYNPTETEKETYEEFDHFLKTN